MTPLFDSLTHPTRTGRFLGKKEASFAALCAALKKNKIQKACAVGIAGCDGYEHELFMRECRRHPELVPIAGFDPACGNVRKELEKIKALGYRGIKIHPRFSGLDPADSRFTRAFEAAMRQKLVIFYCTYEHSHLVTYPAADPFYSLVRHLKKAPEAKVVLLHGGNVRLLQYAELVRSNPNLLLDLSFTLMKYPGSSLDLDIRFLMRHFDRKLSVGSDYPDFSIKDFRTRFEALSRGIEKSKLQNIAYKNLEKFLGF